MWIFRGRCKIRVPTHTTTDCNRVSGPRKLETVKERVPLREEGHALVRMEVGLQVVSRRAIHLIQECST
jgi:hypothetical protein